MTYDTSFSNFETLADFKWSLKNGGEIEFEWNGNSFGIFKYMKKTPDSPEQILIAPSAETEDMYPGRYPSSYVDDIDDVLDYDIDGEKLRNIITLIEVLWRNI